MRGRFITLEGGEGTGKSTQAAMLVRRLKSLGLDAVQTREPGGSPGAEAIRHVLLAGGAEPLGPDAEALLFAAARDDHIRQTIRPALDRGAWVVCDRFADSTRVYQGALGNVDPRLIRALERVVLDGLKPDLTFILDLPPSVGLARAAKRRGRGSADRFETEAPSFHEKLREAYRELARLEPDRCVLIDARAGKDKVAEQIWSVTVDRLRPSASRTELAGAGS
ncbi:MAG TPA: dTMP kinase [Xanthobacteraceae bacterium]|nr:dTMP kinase [Xanthobacteraceae bacterium]